MNPKLLRSALIVLLLAVQLGAVFVVMLGMRKEALELAVGQAQSSLDNLADTVASQTGHVLEPAESTISLASRLIAQGVVDATDNSQLENFFLAQLQAKPQVNGLYLGRADGTFVLASRNEEGLLTRTIRLERGRQVALMTQRTAELGYLRSWVDLQQKYNPRNRPWYQLARQSNELNWTGAYNFFDSATAGITAALEVSYPDGSDAGVIGVDIEIRELSGTLAQFAGQGSGQALLLDEHAHVIASTGAVQSPSVGLDGELPTLAQIPDPVMASLFERAQAASGAGDDQPLRLATNRFTINGDEYIGLVRPVTAPNGRTNWSMLIQLPAAEILGPVDDFYGKRLRMLMAVLIVTAVIGALALFALSEPRLRRAAELGVDPSSGALTRAEFERRLQGMTTCRRDSESTGRIYVVALDLEGVGPMLEQISPADPELGLTEFVTRLKRKIRQNDLVGRGDGEAFILAIRLDRRADALETIERIRSEVMGGRYGLAVASSEIALTAGIAGYDIESGETVPSLLGRAGQALFTGKVRGRNRCYMAPDFHARWPETVVTALTAQRAARRREGSATSDEPNR